MTSSPHKGLPKSPADTLHTQDAANCAAGQFTKRQRARSRMQQLVQSTTASSTTWAICVFVGGSFLFGFGSQQTTKATAAEFQNGWSAKSFPIACHVRRVRPAASEPCWNSSVRNRQPQTAGSTDDRNYRFVKRGFVLSKKKNHTHTKAST